MHRTLRRPHCNHRPPRAPLQLQRTPPLRSASHPHGGGFGSGWKGRRGGSDISFTSAFILYQTLQAFDAKCGVLRSAPTPPQPSPPCAAHGLSWCTGEDRCVTHVPVAVRLVLSPVYADEGARYNGTCGVRRSSCVHTCQNTIKGSASSPMGSK